MAGRGLIRTVLVLVLLTAGPAFTQPKTRYDIPAQSLDLSLMALAAKSDRQITFAPASVRGKRARALTGSYDVMGALGELLKGNDLTVETVGGVILVLPAPPRPAAPPAYTPPAKTPIATLPGSVQAELNPPDTPLSQVVVTATKRATLVQNTPISISVQFNGVAERGDIQTNDYYRRIPGLQMTSNFANQERLSIRGVRSTGDATTGLYYDETPVTGPAGSAADAGSTQPDLNLFDTQRIEVLRGPQGTLYGAGSMGGAVRIIFNKPDLTQSAGRVEARGRSTDGGEPSGSIRAMGNLVLVPDKLAVRAVGYEEQNGGYIDNVRFGRSDVNGSQSYGARLALSFRPVDTIALSATAITQHDHADDSDNYWYPRLGPYNSDASVAGSYRGGFNLYSASGRWRLPHATVTAIASRYEWKTREVSDYTYTLQRAAADASACPRYFAQVAACGGAQQDAFNAYVATRLPGAWYQPDTLRASSEEVRVTSALGARVSWIAGLFHEDRWDHFDSLVYQADPTSGAVRSIPDDATGYRYIETRVRQLAAYGEVEVRPLKPLSLTLGARRYSYDKMTDGQVVTPNLITGSAAGPFAAVSARASGWVTKAAAAYQVTSSAMVYVNRQEGFRPGGANNVPGAGSAVPATYAPDSLVSYEAGVKTGWLDQRVNVNAALYRIDWDNMQVRASSYSGAWVFNVNAGAARVTGAELEITSQLTPTLYLSASAARTDARLISDQRSALGYATGVRGDRLPYTPRWAGAASALYRWPVWDGVQGMARFDYSFTGRTASDFHPGIVTYQVQPAYQLVDIQIGLQRGGAQVSVRVNNLFNVLAPSMIEANLSGVQGQTFSSRPRTVTFAVRQLF